MIAISVEKRAKRFQVFIQKTDDWDQRWPDVGPTGAPVVAIAEWDTEQIARATANWADTSPNRRTGSCCGQSWPNRKRWTRWACDCRRWPVVASGPICLRSRGKVSRHCPPGGPTSPWIGRTRCSQRTVQRYEEVFPVLCRTCFPPTLWVPIGCHWSRLSGDGHRLRTKSVVTSGWLTSGVLFDIATPLGQRVERRLRTDVVD